MKEDRPKAQVQDALHPCEWKASRPDCKSFG